MKKNKMKKLTSALLVGLLCVGGAFAWLNTSAVDENSQAITAGTFALNFDNEDDVIGLTAAYPMTAEEGEALDPYVFTLDNDGTIDVMAKIGVEHATVAESEEADDMIPDSVVQVVIWEDQREAGAEEAVWVKVYDNTLASMHGEEVFGVTAAERIDAGESRSYKAVAYILDSATNADLYGDAGDEARDINFKLQVFYAQADGGLDHATEWDNLTWTAVE